MMSSTTTTSRTDANEFGVVNKAAIKVQESDTNPIGGGGDDDDANHHRPSQSSFQIGGGDDRGPTRNNNDDDDDDNSSRSHINNAIGGVSFAGLKTLPPFDYAAGSTQSSFKSPGMAAATMGFPFTNGQWRELQRQALIYKYMMASVPVPPDLLFPFTRNSAAASVGAASGLNPSRFSKGGDAEPWRCRRTDGKKWRCSRDVAPEHKYCERHLHRGRPRSRKHVELAASNNKKTRLQPYPSTNSSASLSQFVGNLTQYPPMKEQRCVKCSVSSSSASS